jgi:hypothetical protein
MDVWRAFGPEVVGGIVSGEGFETTDRHRLILSQERGDGGSGCLSFDAAAIVDAKEGMFRGS